MKKNIINPIIIAQVLFFAAVAFLGCDNGGGSSSEDIKSSSSQMNGGMGVSSSSIAAQSSSSALRSSSSAAKEIDFNNLYWVCDGTARRGSDELGDARIYSHKEHPDYPGKGQRAQSGDTLFVYLPDGSTAIATPNPASSNIASPACGATSNMAAAPTNGNANVTVRVTSDVSACDATRTNPCVLGQ